MANFCTCGLAMSAINKTSTLTFCPNCDRTQDVERTPPGKRETTVHDRRFSLEWAGRQRAIFGR